VECGVAFCEQPRLADITMFYMIGRTKARVIFEHSGKMNDHAHDIGGRRPNPDQGSRRRLGLVSLIDAGKIDPASILAILGKTRATAA